MTAVLPTPTPAPATSLDTRHRILAAALRMFGERGYAATSFRDIAVELGLTKAAVYYHFPSKEGLVTALIEPLFAHFEEALAAPATSRRDFLSRLQDIIVELGPVLGVLTNDPSLAEAGAVIHLRAKAMLTRSAQVLAGPHPSRVRLVRAHVALGGLFGGMRGLHLAAPDVPLSRRDCATILDATLAALEA